MTYQLDFSRQANRDIDFHKKSGNKVLLKKLLIVLEELIEHPTTGAGKPEQLKQHRLAGYWSRKINREHRLVYKILKNTVRVYSARGYY